MPDGSVFTSSALTPVTFQNVLQPIIAQILGLDPVGNPAAAFSAVRVGWQQEGQPAWGIKDDVCILRATLENDDFARVRDDIYETVVDTDLISQMGFTQVWKLHLCLYGPNCEDHARQILSIITLQWVNEALAVNNLYRIPASPRPEYVPENFMGQWWPRTEIGRAHV